MNANKIDILCDQVIDVALVVKEATNVIDNSKLSCYPQQFVNRVNSVVQYCYNMFMNANADKHNDSEITDLMINLMNTLVRYKNSYHPNTYAYRVMNSLLDIVKNTFVELN
jgi:hypothetical protein